MSFFDKIGKVSSARRILNYGILTEATAVSGGQKSRVAFAKITFKKPHIILLDEPSNHLVSKPPKGPSERGLTLSIFLGWL